MIRVLLAEDQTMVRGALSALLALEGDIEVVAEVARGDQIVTAAEKALPDVALLDIELPGIDGLVAAAMLRDRIPGIRVIMLTTFGRPGYLRRAMEAGAIGYVLKDAPADTLATAIRRAMEGKRTVDPTLAVSALSEGGNPLTSRERDVLAASREVATIAEIASGCTSPRAPCATTCRWRSRSSRRTTGPRPCGSPRRRAGWTRRWTPAEPWLPAVGDGRVAASSAGHGPG